MAHAQVNDVTELWAIDPEPEIEALIARRLEQVERMIKRRIADLDDRVDTDPVFKADVIDIESDAVLRLVRNPEGYQSETDGDYTYMLRSDLTSGELKITASEWEILGIKLPRVFTLVPSFEMPT